MKKRTKILAIIAIVLAAGMAANAAIRSITDGYEVFSLPVTPKRPAPMTCEAHGYLSEAKSDMTCSPLYTEGRFCYVCSPKPFETPEPCVGDDCGEPQVATCAHYKYLDAVPVNQRCQMVKIDDGKTCYKDCQTMCESYNYNSKVPVGQTCSTVKFDGYTCYNNCRSVSCTDLGYRSAPVSGMVCSTITYQDKTCYRCVRQEEICSSGGYVRYVPVNNRCRQVTYMSSTCYTDCRPLTCVDIGYYDGEQPELKCNRKIIDEYYNNCFECRSYKCSDGGYLDNPPSGRSCPSVQFNGLTCYNFNTCK